MIDASKFDQEFLDIMKEIAEAQGVTIENLIEAWCINRLAKDQAHIRVYGSPAGLPPMLEAARHDGETLRGQELFQWLLEYYQQQKEKEYGKELKKGKVKHDIPLTEHEKKILERVK